MRTEASRLDLQKRKEARAVVRAERKEANRVLERARRRERALARDDAAAQQFQRFTAMKHDDYVD